MTNNAPEVEIETRGHVAVVTFSNPPFNYFNAQLLESIASALQNIDDQPETRVVLLRSTGKVFCAGADFSDQEGQGNALFDPADIYRAGLKLFQTRKPIVAEIQGATVGGGLGLAMVADFRIAAETAKFTGNFTKIGIHAGFGLTHTLPRIIGHQATALLLYTGRRISGKEAQVMGLVDEVVPLEQLHQTAFKLAEEIAAAAPLAVEATRQTLRAGLANAIAQQILHETTEQIRLFKTDDYKEGVEAVKARREGRWTRN
ncbi:enoyl-CoA hydratase/isomerase family protein [Pseudomonas fluorescens]|uniref:Putative enoyl-CoA hydratase echA8 n=1 Tax=Pseudomonas fluorescens TaxID=294 RepID=A0A5E7CF16_PSEFL|nr:enoyl-CoA hydratase/isomerase family protein [Pseudomonas fluorescens]VVO03423.1 putative enoyl-CoA hydratase echA8 [Pseudomonas fluorescens]